MEGPWAQTGLREPSEGRLEGGQRKLAVGETEKNPEQVKAGVKDAVHTGGKSELGQSWGLRSLLPRCCLPGSGLNETVPEQWMPQPCP